MEDNNNVTLTPQYEFFSVTVELQEEDPETGKIKKTKEEQLVDGRNVTEVESKVKAYMEGTMCEWKIIKCQTSKIGVVY